MTAQHQWLILILEYLTLKRTFHCSILLDIIYTNLISLILLLDRLLPMMLVIWILFPSVETFITTLEFLLQMFIHAFQFIILMLNLVMQLLLIV